MNYLVFSILYLDLNVNYQVFKKKKNIPLNK